MEKLAVIVPYRNRAEHLKVFMPYMEKSLAEEKVPFDIFIIEQHDDKPFNRAKLLNVGFSEAKEYDYFAFQDKIKRYLKQIVPLRSQKRQEEIAINFYS